MRTDCQQEVQGGIVLLWIKLLRYWRGLLWCGELVPEELEWVCQPLQGLDDSDRFRDRGRLMDDDDDTG